MEVRTAVLLGVLVFSFSGCSDSGTGNRSRDGGSACQRDGCPDTFEPGPDECPSCTDNLLCTENLCGDGGSCVYQLKSGFCLIDGVCYADQTQHPDSPCQVCDAAKLSSGWTPRSEGESCEDGDPCTKDDSCTAKMCQGTPYTCANDWLDCTDDSCDGQGGCDYSLKTGFCTIQVGGTVSCFEAGERNPAAPPGTCEACDPAVSQTSWSPIQQSCTIAGVCYAAGQRDPTGCETCDPAQDKTSWSPAASACQIDGRCYQAGDQDPSRCNVCDPNKSTTSWSASTAACQVDGKCYQAGEADSTGCGVCEPAQSTTSLSHSTTVCKISGKCYPDGAVFSTGCATCDVGKSTSGWTPLPGYCLANDPDGYGKQCYKAGEKTTVGSCYVCDPARSQRELSTVANPDCAISLPGGCFNAGESDPAAGSCAICDPTTSKSDWTIVSGCLLPDTLTRKPTCYAAGDLDDYGCGQCDPAQSQTSWSAVSGTCQISTGGHVDCPANGAQHPTGSCASCDTAKSVSEWTIASGCLIAGQCYAAGASDPGGCGSCDPATSTVDWTGRPTTGCTLYDPIDRRDKCYPPGAHHPTGACAICDPSKDTIYWTVASGCLISSGTSGPQCYESGAVSPTGCYVCDPARSVYSWSESTALRCTAQVLDSGGSGDYVTACYGNGVSHPTGTCAVCDTSSGTGSWNITSGCLISSKCYWAGDADPAGCGICDPTQNTTGWTPGPGGVCKIGSPWPACYDNGATHPTGNCAVCDVAKSASNWTLMSGCLIKDTCHQSGDLGLGGCMVCDPTKNQTAWTPVSGKCLIGFLSPTCYNNGDANPSGSCAVCDSSQSTSAWTIVAGCLIQGACYKSGDLSASGCEICDPTKSTTAWTSPSAGICMVDQSCFGNGAMDETGCAQCNTSATLPWSPVAGTTNAEYGFDSGTLGGVAVTPAVAGVGWQVSSKRAATGTYSLYYGNPATGTYDNGTSNEGTATLPAMTLPAGKKALLLFSFWPDAAFEGSDVLEVKINGQTVWVARFAVPKIIAKTWQQRAIDLSALAGNTVSVSMHFKSIFPFTREGVYLDDIRVLTNCP